MNNRIHDTTDKFQVAELVRAAQRGQSEAFGALVERYESSVFGAALRRLRNYADAQELCQDVFVRAFQKLGQLREPECFGGWIHAIGARLAINFVLRRPAHVTLEPGLLEASCVDSPNPAAAAIGAERETHVHEGLARLRTMDRQTLEAFYLHGRSIREMSDEFDAPVGTIKRRLHVARRRLAEEVGDLVAV